MPYAYATGETRVWTARDEHELKAEHRRATRATRKHLNNLQVEAAAQAEKEQSPGAEDRTFMDKLLRRRNYTNVEAAAQAEKEQSPGAEDRTFMDKLLRRRNASNFHDREASLEVNHTDLPPEKRPLPHKTKQPQEGNSHWWSRGHRQTSSQSAQVTVERVPYTPLGVANSTLPPPPIPPRIDLMSLPDRVRRKSENDAAARRRARQRALYHLETDHDIRRFVVLDKPDDPPIQLKPGTWIPGQINVVDFTREVIAADKRVDVDEFGGLTTPQLAERFPTPSRSLPPRKNAPHRPLPSPPSGPAYTHIPPTRPLNIVPRHKHQDVRNVPVPHIPAEPEKSNRDSFLELRRKRSHRVYIPAEPEKSNRDSFLELRRKRSHRV
ncbi:hypothetical protein RSAG8_06788, partial [Rhizoctonia solani AG-8 WAC10335]